MRDLVVDGARFCTALEPFSVDQAKATLEQIAHLHAGAALLERTRWVGRRIADFADRGLMPPAVLQQLLDGPRGEGLDARTRDAARLIAGLSALSARDAQQPQTLVHGDAHAGNIYMTAEGPGLIDWQLIQRGSWALDVPYHLCAVLPVEVAEAHEWELLDHYLDAARRLGVDVPPREAAQAQYRAGVVYGYYLWSITRRVDPEITNTFVDRLGKAVARLDSYRVLGLD
jgi:aminoglycoside/choline kinase family phosphotransferase